MLQTINGLDVYVVDFDTLPETPITYATPEEKPYAAALGAALATGVVTEPGKYAIHVLSDGEPLRYSIFTIKE
jgi:hypothetical protein